jgi:PII-like signaling protein
MHLPEDGVGVDDDRQSQLRLTADDRDLDTVDAELLRIFIGTEHKYQRKPLYEAIVLAAREHHLAGATVVRGALGYGANSRIHTSKILRVSEDLPVIVEIVDSPEKIEAFLPVVDAMMDKGLITLEPVRVIAYRHSGG